jgi:UDP-glucose 4-epimerase
MTACVVVTGASGFVGQALLHELASRGAEVVAVARGPMRRVAGVRTVTVADYAATPAPDGAVLVHLADGASLAEAEKDGDACIQARRQLISDLLAPSRRRVVYASSGVVYGNAARRAHAPGDPTPDRSVYARAKLAAETLVNASQGGVSVRLGNVYGPPVKLGTVLGDILGQIPGRGPLHLRDARPARDFVWIDDVARGLADIALGEATGTYNLGTGTASSIGDVARAALRAAGEEERPVVAEASQDEGVIDVIALDSSSTTAAFGWSPQIALETGLRRLIGDRI